MTDQDFEGYSMVSCRGFQGDHYKNLLKEANESFNFNLILVSKGGGLIFIILAQKIILKAPCAAFANSDITYCNLIDSARSSSGPIHWLSPMPHEFIF